MFVQLSSFHTTYGSSHDNHVGAEGVCQAGQMRGLEDHRSGLIVQVFRLVDDLPNLKRCCMYLHVLVNHCVQVFLLGCFRVAAG